MFHKAFKFIFILGVISFVSLTVIYFISKAYYTNLAQKKAERIIDSVKILDDTEYNQTLKQIELIALTRAVYSVFKADEPSNHWQLRLRPYLTNSALPSFIRYEEGVIETLIGTGLCDNAARFLHFVLKQRGHDSVQWNMVTNTRAHSILLVYLDDGKTAILDPMFGLIGYNQATQSLLSPFEIHKRMQGGAVLDDVFLTLDEKSETEFYEDFANVRMEKLGKPLEIDADLPYIENDGLIFLGQIDGNEKDVYDAAAAHNMSPFWHYAGHKYDRSWIRSLKAHQDVRLEFILVSDVEDNVLTSDKAPIVDGRIMRWDLNKGDVLKFYDGRAKRSFKRMNSYINLDQIAIYRR